MVFNEGNMEGIENAISGTVPKAIGLQHIRPVQITALLIRVHVHNHAGGTSLTRGSAWEELLDKGLCHMIMNLRR